MKKWRAFWLVMVILNLTNSFALPAAAQMNRARLQPLLLQAAFTDPAELLRVIVQMDSEKALSAQQVTALGGELVQSLSIINAVVVHGPAQMMPALAQVEGVRWISLDAPMTRVSEVTAADSLHFRDEFDGMSYAGSNGRMIWSGPWQEVGENDGPAAGDLAITTFLAGSQQGLRLQGSDKGIWRQLDLSAATEAQLTFAYRRKAFGDSNDFIRVEVSPDGETNWVTLDQIAGPAYDETLMAAHYDLSPYLSATTTVRFMTAGAMSADAQFHLDLIDVEMSMTVPEVEQISAQELAAQAEAEYRTAWHVAFSNRVYLPLIAGSDVAQAALPADTLQAAATAAPNYVYDTLDLESWSNNMGNVAWAGNWIELGEPYSYATPATGDVEIERPALLNSNKCLEIRSNNNGIMRKVNLAKTQNVVLSFDYKRDSLEWNESVAVQVSKDNGATWTDLAYLAGWSHDLFFLSASYDISAYASSQTYIRFLSSGNMNGLDSVCLDNIKIAYTPKPTCAKCIESTALLNTYVRSIKADGLWNNAAYLQGEGITVAVVDSGIADHPDLRDENGNNRIIQHVHINQSGISDDFYGHGTHIAGTIGGRGVESAGGYIGVAPSVKFIDVKVMNDAGMGTLSEVVGGLQWIYNNRQLYNIRIVNMSLNSTVAESYHTSPLNAALEILWFNGVTVVVSAGNNGSTNAGTIYPPANDPFVITVGAVDEKSTAALTDDLLASFSAYGTTIDGFAKPDLVAPGSNIIATLSSGDNNLATAHPLNKVPGTLTNVYFRMSGTSMAAAVATGAVALLLQDEPNLTPDQVKFRLQATANKSWSGYNSQKMGAGYLDIAAAVQGTTTQSANTGRVASQLLWTGSAPVMWGSVSWNSVSWNSVSWNSVSWNSVSWNSVSWNSEHWD